MKKISTILVLMLIALMLFVSCNNSTPTKDNSTPAEETPKVRAATDDDYTLFITLSNVIMSDLENREPEERPTGASFSADSSTITLDSCEFDSYAIDGSSLHVKLNGTVTVKSEGEAENIVYYYTFNLTEGSTIGNTAFTAYIEFSSTGTSKEANFSKITINDAKITGFTELVKERITRVATPDDIEITKKLLNVFDNINALTPEGKLALKTSGQLDIVYDSEYNPTYIFNNFNQSYSGTNYFLNGTVTVTRNLDSSFSIECDFINNGTKLDNKNYSIMANGTQKEVGGNVIFTFSEAIINCTNITGLQVTI